MPISSLKYLRVHTDPHGATRYYFVATYAPIPDPAASAGSAPRPITVRFPLAGRPDEPAFIDHYWRTLDTIKRGAVWVR